MDLTPLLKGLLIGLYIASPIGPISVLCIKRTLKDGKKFGLASACGVTSAEVFYASISLFGLTLISDFLLAQKFFLQLFGGIFLLYLGAVTFFSHPQNRVRTHPKSRCDESETADSRAPHRSVLDIREKRSAANLLFTAIAGRDFGWVRRVEKETSLLHGYISIFFLTLSNPMTILSFVAIFTNFSLDEKHHSFTSASLTLLGYAIGSLTCYSTLVTITTILRKKFDAKLMQILNRISGVVIAGFGVVILGRVW